MKILIVVDMLNDFLDPSGSLYCGGAARKIIPYIQERLVEYRNCKDCVIYIVDSHEKEDKEFERFPKHAVKGTWGADVIYECAPKNHEMVIEKTRFSGFFKTPLGRYISSMTRWSNLEMVEVVGVCTSICVMDTVAGFANRDILTIVPRAGVADFDSEMHEFSLKRMEAIYGAKII